MCAKKKSDIKNDGDWKRDLRYGRGVSIRFFRNNAWILALVIVLVLVLIGLRYRTKTRMMEIKQLSVELEQARSQKLEEKAAYMSLIRESEMKRLVEKQGLNLEFQTAPPYKLYATDPDATK